MLLVGVRAAHLYAVRYAVEVPNVAEDPINRFRVKTASIPDGCTMADLVGCLHTHPAGPSSPSSIDLSQLPAGWIGGALYSGRVGWYRTGRREPSTVVRYL